MSSAFHNWASSRIERRAYASRVMGGSLLVFASKALSVALMCTVYAKGLKEEEEEEDGRRLLGTGLGGVKTYLASSRTSDSSVRNSSDIRIAWRRYSFAPPAPTSPSAN